MGASGLGNLLVKEGFLTEQDRTTINKTCGEGSWAFAKSILTMGLLDEDELAAFFAERTRYVVAAKNFLSQLDPQIAEQVDRPMFARLEILPLEIDEQKITVAVADPLDKATLKQLEFFTGLEIVPIIAPLSQIYEGLTRLIPEFQPRFSALASFLRNHAGAAWVKQKITEQPDLLDGPARSGARGSPDYESDIEEMDDDDGDDIEAVEEGEDETSFASSDGDDLDFDEGPKDRASMSALETDDSILDGDLSGEDDFDAFGDDDLAPPSTQKAGALADSEGLDGEESADDAFGLEGMEGSLGPDDDDAALEASADGELGLDDELSSLGPDDESEEDSTPPQKVAGKKVLEDDGLGDLGALDDEGSGLDAFDNADDSAFEETAQALSDSDALAGTLDDETEFDEEAHNKAAQGSASADEIDFEATSTAESGTDDFGLEAGAEEAPGSGLEEDPLLADEMDFESDALDATDLEEETTPAVSLSSEGDSSFDEGDLDLAAEGSPDTEISLEDESMGADAIAFEDESEIGLEEESATTRAASLADDEIGLEDENEPTRAPSSADDDEISLEDESEGESEPTRATSPADDDEISLEDESIELEDMSLSEEAHPEESLDGDSLEVDLRASAQASEPGELEEEEQVDLSDAEDPVSGHFESEDSEADPYTAFDQNNPMPLDILRASLRAKPDEADRATAPRLEDSAPGTSHEAQQTQTEASESILDFDPQELNRSSDFDSLEMIPISPVQDSPMQGPAAAARDPSRAKSDLSALANELILRSSLSFDDKGIWELINFYAPLLAPEGCLMTFTPKGEVLLSWEKNALRSEPLPPAWLAFLKKLLPQLQKGAWLRLQLPPSSGWPGAAQELALFRSAHDSPSLVWLAAHSLDEEVLLDALAQTLTRWEKMKKKS